MSLCKKSVAYLVGAITVTGSLLTTAVAGEHKKHYPVSIEMFAPARGDRVGIGGRGWFVDLAIAYDTPLAQSGFTLNGDGQAGFQLTGPGGHNNIGPMPGTFSLGRDERLPGLIVLLSTTAVGAGSCHNLANLFNLTGVTNLSATATELWDTWIVGAPNFGLETESTIYVAVADDLNGDGIYNDAPAIVPDVDGNGVCDRRDLKRLGLASQIKSARFYINGAVSLEGVPLSE